MITKKYIKNYQSLVLKRAKCENSGLSKPRFKAREARKESRFKARSAKRASCQGAKREESSYQSAKRGRSPLSKREARREPLSRREGWVGFELGFGFGLGWVLFGFWLGLS